MPDGIERAKVRIVESRKGAWKGSTNLRFHVLGDAKTLAIDRTGGGCDLWNSVALLCDMPERGLVRGQVGTIVEPLDETIALAACRT